MNGRRTAGRALRRGILIAASSPLVVGCFSSPPPAGGTTDATEVGSATFVGSTDPTGAPSTTSSAGSSDSGGSESTGSEATGSTSGAPATSTTTSSTAGTSGTTGSADWVAACAAVEIEILPVPPVAADEWVVQFRDDAGLTNLELSVSDGAAQSVYGVDNTDCFLGAPPFCWEFAPWVDVWGAGTLTLEVTADAFPGATCDIVLE